MRLHHQPAWCGLLQSAGKGNSMTVSSNTIESITQLGEYDTRRSYLDYLASILSPREAPAISLPSIVKAVACRVQRAARAVRSAVRQTFAARKAAKAADSGGGSSDPDGRRPHTETNTSNTPSPVSAFLFGGAK